ncbi:HU family DNA-binding protein [Geomonas subterranea]|uniref:HU family DNA-binding protein n=1 Tax=Geomonas subterranea TaxID=2847989 RepID=UPI001CD67898|nr:HU family DNA-binding protein [Geomonas fuzhouensis]
MRRKIVIKAPAPEPRGLLESIRSMEQTANLLKTLKANGVSKEQRSKMIISDIVESNRPQKIVNWSEYQIIGEIRKVLQVSEYEASSILEAILTVLTQAMVSGQRVKLNKLGTLSVETQRLTRTVVFRASPALVSSAAE